MRSRYQLQVSSQQACRIEPAARSDNFQHSTARRRLIVPTNQTSGQQHFPCARTLKLAPVRPHAGRGFLFSLTSAKSDLDHQTSEACDVTSLTPSLTAPNVLTALGSLCSRCFAEPPRSKAFFVRFGGNHEAKTILRSLRMRRAWAASSTPLVPGICTSVSKVVTKAAQREDAKHWSPTGW
jgi:hypothetical protein